MSVINMPNRYPTDEEERDALCVTFASQAGAAIMQHYIASDLPDDDPWAQKVDFYLCDVMQKLEAMAREELEQRPGLLAAGREYRRRRDAEFAERADEIEAALGLTDPA